MANPPGAKRMRTRSSDKPSDTVASLFRRSEERTRERCQFETVCDHRDIAQNLNKIIGHGWRIIQPTIDSKDSLYTNWPQDDALAGVKEFLSESGCKDPEDTINGACEPLALYLARHIADAVHEAQEGASIDGLVNSAHVETLNRLIGMDAAEAAKEVFLKDHFAGGFQNGRSTWTTAGAWGSQFADCNFETLLLGSGTFEDSLKRLAASLTEESGGHRTATHPMYVMNYIFDEKELSDLGKADKETAQYSCHAIGLVVDSDRRAVILADPNGALMESGVGNIEFLAIPLKERKRGNWSTKVGGLGSGA